MKDVARSHQKAQTISDQALGWPGPVRVIVSLILLWHLSAVIVSPWSRPPPVSELSTRVAQYYRPYINALHLNQGYRFFAPDPPPESNIIRYEVTKSDGTVHKGEFPDRRADWPRLLYHRHFMITAQVIAETVPPPESIVPAEMPPAFFAEASKQEIKQYRLERQEYVDRLHQSVPELESLARHLLNQYGGESVKLYDVSHRVPRIGDVRNGMKLTADSLYSKREIGELTAGREWSWAEGIGGRRIELLP